MLSRRGDGRRKPKVSEPSMDLDLTGLQRLRVHLFMHVRFGKRDGQVDELL